jgi:BirA family transcriptional regulator, biotin operon repressor / biotin---[acetyl-CoA-carboxylase] ligase
MSIHVDAVLCETFARQVECHEELASTNDRAAQCASALSTELPLVVVANRQTAGRGRHGNRWWTGDGCLAMSLLIDAESISADCQRSPLIALAAATAAVDAVSPRLSPYNSHETRLSSAKGERSESVESETSASRQNLQVGIHWPNDVYVHQPSLGPQGDRKLVGILVEVLPNRRHVIGIGINTNNTLVDAPSELQAKICTLRDLLGEEQDQTAILISLLQCLKREFQQLRTEPKHIAARVDQLCLQHDRTLTMETGGKNICGRCQGIDCDGALLLATSSGVQRIVSGRIVAMQ